MTDRLLTDEDISKAVSNHLSDWAMAEYDDRWDDESLCRDSHAVIRQAQDAKTEPIVRADERREMYEWLVAPCCHNPWRQRRECPVCLNWPVVCAMMANGEAPWTFRSPSEARPGQRDAAPTVPGSECPGYSDGTCDATD
ncbi:hypothetical protein LCGC14_3021160, partial [marine sediment metagenome]